MARLLLASRGIPNLAAIARAKGTRALLVSDAADPLREPDIPAEVERINGSRVREARAHGVDTPLQDAVYALVRGRESAYA